MPSQDLSSLRRSVNSIISNIEVYRKDIGRSMELLKHNYDIDGSEIDNIDKEIERLEKSLDKLDDRKDKLITKANKILEGIDNE